MDSQGSRNHPLALKNALTAVLDSHTVDAVKLGSGHQLKLLLREKHSRESQYKIPVGSSHPLLLTEVVQHQPAQTDKEPGLVSQR